MAALTDTEYKKFHALADSIGLDVLVETHNEEEVKRAVEYGRIIGVNNRNLQTFDEDITTCERLLPLIPNGKVKVAESAIRKHSDFEYLRGLKFDAALIGEAFMREKDIKKIFSSGQSCYFTSFFNLSYNICNPVIPSNENSPSYQTLL